MKRHLVFSSAALLLMVSSIQATIIHVPEDFAAIQTAIDSCLTGDTVSVAPGTYYESLILWWDSSKAVTILARGDRDSTILQAPAGERVAFFCLGVDTTTVLQGFTIVGDTLNDGIYTTGGAKPIIYGNIIKNCQTGIRTSCGSAVIRKNEILECRSHYPVWSSAIRLSNTMQTVIDSNYIHDNFNEHGATVDLNFCGHGTVFEHNIICSNQGAFGCGMAISHCPDIIIANNTIVDNISTNWIEGAIVVGWDSYAQIKNNIIAFNTDRGVFVNGATADAIYNDFYENSSGPIFGIPEGIGCLHSNPLFTNRADRDFRLLGLSPCIDSGDPATPNDPDGTLPDMGALYALYLTDYGVIQGSIVNQIPEPVENVAVALLGSALVDSSDSGGLFSLGGMPQGSYSIFFSKYGYAETTLTDINVLPGDTTDLNIVLRPFIGCQYIAGDVNASDSYNGLDITYGVNFFKGGSEPMCPFGSCPTPPCDAFFYCGDVNGSCSYNGLDITYGVAYFKGGPAPNPCPDCPPSDAASAARIERPAVQRFLKPKRSSDNREFK